MLGKLIKVLRKVSPWKGGSYQCSGCGRVTIHTGTCPYCGSRVQ